MAPKLQIAVVGPGGIGSTFAFQLARAGHEVTVVARGARLAQLQQAQAIVKTDGESASVSVSDQLDASTGWDLVLVTVLASQVDAVLPALTASVAKTVLFMFNTVEPLARLRDAVGPARFAFGFPAIMASLQDGKLDASIVSLGQITTVTDKAWAEVFAAAGIPSVVHTDMESWLRSHAAFIVPIMLLGDMVRTQRRGASWSEAAGLARAMKEGFAMVRELGNVVTPAAMVLLSRMPDAALATLLWSLSRTPMVRKAGARGPREVRALIDAMNALANGRTPRLLALRP